MSDRTTTELVRSLCADIELAAHILHFPQYETLVRFVSETGLRSGEVAALRISDIDLAGRRVYVCRSATEMRGEIHYDETKTYETRSVPLTQSIADELAQHLETRPADVSAFVFTSADGSPLKHKNFYQRHFKRAVAQSVDENGRALIPPQSRFHDLRHTYAALLIAAGANPLTVKQRMGHSSITVTMDRYGHLFPHLEEDLTERMDQAYRESNSKRDVAQMLHAEPNHEALTDNRLERKRSDQGN